LGIWGASPSDVYAVGSTQYPIIGWLGWIYRYDGASWSEVFSSTISPRCVWGSSANDVYVGIDGQAILHGSAHSWRLEEIPCKFGLAGLWGASPSDVFAVGEGDGLSCVAHYDGQSWSAMSQGQLMAFSGVWGSSHTDVFAVGGVNYGINGAIIHYDGASWSAITGGPFWSLQGIWGSGLGDVFAVGYDPAGNGAIYHYGPPE